jgi:NAD(P)-dependent dehydrogenase (short-subunit alcohol dehydrogenase family)
LQLDVRDAPAVSEAIDSLPVAWQAIDVLVNNAGLSRGLAPLNEGDIDDWDEMIDTNVKGLLYVSRAVIPGMVQRQSGHVINIGSIAGREVYANGAVYCASKWAVRALTQGLRVDLHDTPVRVTTEALRLDPSNERALEQTARIIEQYLSWAEDALLRGQNPRARQHYERATYVHDEVPSAGDRGAISARLEALRRSLGIE